MISSTLLKLRIDVGYIDLIALINSPKIGFNGSSKNWKKWT